MDESHTSLVGLLYWVGFRRVEVPYERAPRPVGQERWSFRRKLRYLLDSVFSFTDLPITLLIADRRRRASSVTSGRASSCRGVG